MNEAGGESAPWVSTRSTRCQSTHDHTAIPATPSTPSATKVAATRGQRRRRARCGLVGIGRSDAVWPRAPGSAAGGGPAPSLDGGSAPGPTRKRRLSGGRLSAGPGAVVGGGWGGSAVDGSGPTAARAEPTSASARGGASGTAPRGASAPASRGASGTASGRASSLRQRSSSGREGESSDTATLDHAVATRCWHVRRWPRRHPGSTRPCRSTHAGAVRLGAGWECQHGPQYAHQPHVPHHARLTS